MNDNDMSIIMPVEILLIEDNPSDVELKLHVFKRNNISDRVQVVRDGKEVLRKIREDPKTRRIPIVVLTSSKEDRDIVDSYALGVNSYIAKPVEFNQFTQAVEDIGHYCANR
jgi:two-component system, response regulator